MSKAVRRTGLALALPAAVLTAVLAAAHLFARQIVESAASAATGRQVRIAGAFDIDYSLVPRMQASRVTLSNPDWSERPDMLAVKALTAAIDLGALLQGRVVLPELRLTAPVLLLEKTAQGPANWDFAGAGRGDARGQGLWLPFIEHFSVRGGRVLYRRAGAQGELVATIDTLDAHAGHGSPLTLAASGDANGITYRLNASGAPLGRLWHGAGQAYPFSLHIQNARQEIHAAGHAVTPIASRQAEIEWTVKGDSLSFLLPDRVARTLDQPYRLEGRAQVSGGHWTVPVLQATIGRNVLRGAMKVDLAGKRPLVRADLHSPALRADLVKELAGLAASADSGRQAPPARGPAGSGLAAIDARVHFSSGKVTGAGLPLTDLALDLVLEDGRLAVDPIRVAVGAGHLDATINVNVAAPLREGKVMLHLDQVPVAPLLAILPGGLHLGGVLDGRFTFAFAPGVTGTAEGHVRYHAPASHTSLDVTLDRVDGPGQRLVRLEVSGRYRGEPASASFTGQPMALLTGPEPVPVDLTVAWGRYRIALAGQAADAGSAFNLRFAASGPGTKTLSRLTGVDLPDLPDYAAHGHVTRQPGLVRIEGLRARIGKSDISGSVSVDDLHYPERIRLDLKAGTLAYTDVDQLMTGKGQRRGLDAWLRGADAEVRMKAGRLIGPEKTVFRNVDIDASLRDGRLRLAPLHFAVGGGAATVRADLANVADAGKGQLRGTLRARITRMRLSEALRPFGLGQYVPGLLDADLHMKLGPGRHQGADSTLHYRDASAGTDIRLALGPAPDRMRLKGRGTVLHHPFWIDGTLGRWTQLASAEPYPFRVAFRLLETDGRFAGAVADPWRLNGLESTLAISGPNPRRVEPVVRFRLPDLPPYRLAGKLTRQDKVWRFSGFQGTVGNTDLSGRIELDQAARKPRVKAALHSRMLDLDDLGGLIGAAPGDGPGDILSLAQKEKARMLRARSAALPDEDLDFPSFLTFDADVHYAADQVKSDTLPLDSLRLAFSVKEGRLHLSPLLIGVAGGVVKADLHLVDRPGERPVRGRVAIDVSRVSLGTILGAFDVARGSAGLISGHGRFRTSGESVAKMLASMSGDASLNMEDGRLNALLVELAGLDAGEALLLWPPKERTVQVACAGIDAVVQGGMLTLDRAWIDTTDTKFTMDGTIDLGNERLDLEILPHPKDVSVLAARAPLIVEGTFRNPDFHPAWGSLLMRGAAALALGAIAPPAALLALVEPGLGEDAPCASLPE